MSETKPPTPGEIQEAKDWLDDDDLLGENATSGYDVSASHIRVILAALDAETARADAAEAHPWDYWHTNSELMARRAETAERERDEARAALARALDSCFCDDGRGLPECARCREIRTALREAGK